MHPISQVFVRLLCSSRAFESEVKGARRLSPPGNGAPELLPNRNFRELPVVRYKSCYRKQDHVIGTNVNMALSLTAGIHKKQRNLNYEEYLLLGYDAV
jgi:hypothetical protein